MRICAEAIKKNKLLQKPKVMRRNSCVGGNVYIFYLSIWELPEKQERSRVWKF